MKNIPTSSDPKSIWNYPPFRGFLERMQVNHPILFASLSGDNDDAYYLFAAVQNRRQHSDDTEEQALRIFCVPVKSNEDNEVNNNG